jgi:hypothetical protein
VLAGMRFQVVKLPIGATPIEPVSQLVSD